jgi:hypothetical protein
MKKIICCLIIFQNIFCLSQTIDANGKKQGYWKKKDEKTNKLIYEGAFLNNIPNGKWWSCYNNTINKCKKCR